MDPSRLPAWSNVPTMLVCDPRLSAAAKLCALAIGVHTNATFEATISRGRIATMMGISLATVKRGIRNLIEHGWLEVHRQKTELEGVHDVNRYRWNFRQAGLSAERMRQGRAVRPASKGSVQAQLDLGKIGQGGRVTSDPTPRVTSEPRGRVKSMVGGRVTSDPHTSDVYTIDERRDDARPEGAASSAPDMVDWRSALAGLGPRVPTD